MPLTPLKSKIVLKHYCNYSARGYTVSINQSTTNTKGNPKMSVIENAYIQQKLDDMEKERDMYQRLFHTYLNEVIALKDKLQTIQAIINPDQTQESE